MVSLDMRHLQVLVPPFFQCICDVCVGVVLFIIDFLVLLILFVIVSFGHYCLY